MKIILVLVLCLISQSVAAFPTTPILSKFNIPNEDPLSDNGNFAGPILNGLNQMKVVSIGTMQSMVVSLQSGTSYWNPSTFGPGSEVYFELPVLWQNNSSDMWTWCNGIAENTAGVDGYAMVVGRGTGSWVWSTWRIDNGVWTQLGADLGTQALSAGDAVGVECGPTGIFQAYYKAVGGTWVTIGTTRSDSTYTSGHIGFSKGYQDITSIVDNFGGGTIVGSACGFLFTENNANVLVTESNNNLVLDLGACDDIPLPIFKGLGRFRGR